MNWEAVASGPAAALAGGVGSALLAQLGIWLHVRREASARRAVEDSGLAIARLGNEETANVRLFRSIDERLTLCERRYEECERAKQDLDARVNELAGTVIRLSAALDIMRSGYAAAGLKEPSLPLLGRGHRTFGDP